MKKQNSQLLSKIARKLRKRQQRKQYRQRTQTTCHFQPLEPRKLLSAGGLMTMAMSAPRSVDSGIVQIEERYRQVDSTWFEDLAPQVTANVDTAVSSLNWKGTDITTITMQKAKAHSTRTGGREERGVTCFLCLARFLCSLFFSASLSLAREVPKTSTDPESYRRTPARIFMTVLFPAPSGPSSPYISRGLTCREKSSTAGSAP